jgi:SAM-dependent methyltransferase
MSPLLTIAPKPGARGDGRRMIDRAIYDSARVAAGYAFDRPPVHQRIIETVASRLAMPLARGLDVGCGAGVSTAALASIARMAVGIDPAARMLAHHGAVAPGARFAIGEAERIPFATGAFDVITAAGSINYADLDPFLREVGRVLAPTGVLVIYDFSAGQRMRGSSQLEHWHQEFERRYPPQPGYDIDVGRLPFAAAGLRLDGQEEMKVALPMTLDSYLRYAMSETAVEVAISGGVPERSIRDWCCATLTPVFGDRTCDVLFDAYAAYVKHADER